MFKLINNKLHPRTHTQLAFNPQTEREAVPIQLCGAEARWVKGELIARLNQISAGPKGIALSIADIGVGQCAGTAVFKTRVEQGLPVPKIIGKLEFNVVGGGIDYAAVAVPKLLSGARVVAIDAAADRVHLCHGCWIGT